MSGVLNFTTREIMFSFRVKHQLECCVRPVRNFVRRLRREDAGVAAIEFAFIAPLMFFMFVGTVELSQAITVDRRVMVVASTTSDLVAREDKIKETQIDTYMQVIEVLLAPYDPAPLRISILAVGAKAATPSIPNPTNPPKICWKYDYPKTSPSTYTINDDYVLPTGIIDVGGSVIVAEVAYTYTPMIFNYFIQGAFPLAEKFYLKPRVSNFIAYDKGDTGTYRNRDAGGSCIWP
jgi:Flp pilus assembly protein TadG